ncbi:MAG: tail fiber domain-containing protein [Candidatus Liptonbacteria bacterium]|nr:tail fiber domain-containing protein [Candidatus Liptonbacteria bacterium]
MYIDNTYNADDGSIFFRTKTSATPVNAMTILGTGLVGIGTASPGALLHVGAAGTAGWGSGSSVGLVSIISGANATPTNGNLRVLTTDSQAIDVGGSIVLGGNYATTVNNFGFASISGRKENGTNANPAGYFQITTTNSVGGVAEAMRITSTGLVGIGTTSPATKLNLSGAGADASGLQMTNTAAGGGTWTMEVGQTGFEPVGGLTFRNTGGTRVVSFGPNYSQVYIGTLPSALNIGILNVDSETNGYAAAVFKNSGSGNPGYPTAVIWNPMTTGANNLLAFYTEGGAGTQRGYIAYDRANGLLLYSTGSDARLKNILGDASSTLAVDRLSQIPVRNYEWKETPGISHVGFVAQELYQTNPEAVAVGGADPKKNPWGIDRSALVPDLVLGFQAHQADINALNSEIAALKKIVCADHPNAEVCQK